ncbi:MAG: hypothetical protein AB7O66_12285, partial [Limisphaerales bacterium]
MTLADWLGSDEEFFPIDAAEFARSRPADEVVATGRALAARALHRLGWEQPHILPSRYFGELFPFLPGPNRLQQALWERAGQSGLFIVEAPMGCGKTEAALGAAYRRWSVRGGEQGLYFALPTQLTSERVFQRMESFLTRALASPELSVLVHGSAWLRDDRILRIRPAEPEQGGPRDELSAEVPRDARRWFASSRKALLARFGSGTIDQALLGAMPAKHCGLRAFGLAGKVVVIDEVHSYDSYTSALVNSLVRDLMSLRATVIVLSATLTARRRRELLTSAGVASLDGPESSPLDPYPMITSATRGTNGVIEVSADAVPWDAADRTVELSHRAADHPRVWDEAVGAAEFGACV